MSSMRPSVTVRFAIVAALLVASISSFMTIPFGPFWGMDFQNIWAFHHCVARDDPYPASGALCGDVIGQTMNYPPLLYWAFVWTRLFAFPTAILVWGTIVALGVVGALLAWARRADWEGPGGARIGLFVGLLAAQFPLTFAIERGNNDVLTVAAWTVAARLHARGRAAWAGCFAALGAVLKVYPGFACVVVACGLAAVAAREARARHGFVAFLLGAAAVPLVAVVAFLHDWTVYVTHTLPRHMHLPVDLQPYGHPLHLLAPESRGWALSLPLLALWCASATIAMRRDATLVFAGALAISTYFAPISWDYNLVTTYPLLLVLFVRSMREDGWLPFGLLVWGLVAVVGHRALFSFDASTVRLHIWLQWGWLVATGLALPRLARGGEPVAVASPAAA